jgi:hypothetical protein
MPQSGDRQLTGYSFGPVTVDVEIDTIGTDRWLRDFLVPAMDATTFGNGEVVIRVMSSHHERDALERGEVSATRMIPCFAFDRHLMALPGWDEGNVTVVADTRLGCFYLIHGRVIDIVGPPDEHLARVGLMRVVREVLTARRLARERLLDLHAAAFEIDQRAVLIAGPKYSGKTALLCHALASRRARLIANDRVLVNLDHDPAEVYGVPTLVSVRPNSLRLFPALRGALFPSDLASRLGSSSVRSAPLAAAVFPEIASGTDAWTLDALSEEEGITLLAACLYGGKRDVTNRTILEEPRGRLLSQIDSRGIATHLAGKVRFFRCRLGRSVPEAGTDAWLQALMID